MHRGQLLYDARRTPLEVFFPHAGTIVSLVRETMEGRQVEVGLIGTEGFASVAALLGNDVDSTVGTVQTGGEVTCVSVPRLRAELENDAATRSLLTSYSSFFLDHLTQSVVCNSLHAIQQRLSKWLLVLGDRIGSPELPVSHDFLARMLGTQRSAVTLAIGVLTGEGLISHARRLVTIESATGLQARACECYAVTMKHLMQHRSRLISYGDVRLPQVGETTIQTARR